MPFPSSGRFGLLILSACLTGSGAGPAFSETLFDIGQRIYERQCSACHSLDHNRIGPHHRMVFGRLAGSLPDYHYSDALKNAGFTWTEERLEAWLADPTEMVPGTSMGFSLGDRQKRKAVIHYLKGLSKLEK